MSTHTYYYGDPRKQGKCAHLLSIFAAHESLHSEKTSSLPLVQFWSQISHEQFSKNVHAVENCIGEKILPRGTDCTFDFEYPVPVQMGVGKASMTDLMIFSSQSQVIAIEAKYTEIAQRYDLIQQWLNKASEDRCSEPGNRDHVLQGWWDCIKKAGCTTQAKISDLRDYKSIPYQLLHRIASACYAYNQVPDNAKLRHRPMVIYQLFYDDGDGNKAITRDSAVTFAKETILRNFAKLNLAPGSLKFFVILTHVTPPARVPHRKEDYGQLFLGMMKNPVYKIGRTELVSEES